MSAVDYTPVLLAQVTDLQMRLTNQDAVIAALKAEVERLAGRSIGVSTGSTMKASVPLLPTSGLAHHDGPRAPRGSPHKARGPRPDGASGAPRRPRPQVAGGAAGGAGSATSSERQTKSLADILTANEQVTITVNTGRDAEGNITTTTALATFDGTELTVTECHLVASMIGMKSTKPGELLYKFIDELKSAGHIQRSFTIAPWRLCSVQRGGKRVTLEELRSFTS